MDSKNFEKMTSSFSELSRPKPSRPKRKEKPLKQKSTDHKSKKHSDVVTQLRDKLANKENGSFSKARYSFPETVTKLGACKKSSETIGKRKALATVGGINEKDIRRLIGKDSPPSYLKPSRRSSLSLLKHGKGSSRLQKENDASTCAQMECSPPAAVTCAPMQDIAARVSEGLQPAVYFPKSEYLKNVKLELRKVMKQSNPEHFQQLIDYFTRPEPSILSPENFEVEPAARFEEDDEDQPTTSSACFSPSLAVLFGTGEMGQSACSPEHDDLLHSLSDSVALHVEVESSHDADMTAPESTPQSPEPGSCGYDIALLPGDSTHQEDHTRRLDFLDLLDTASTAKTTPVGHRSSSEGSDWLVSVGRPRLFPQKLY